MGKKILPLALAALLLCGCGRGKTEPAPVETVDPYAGMIQVESGYGTKIWVNLYEELEVNPLRETVIGTSEEIVDANGQRYDMQTGIDVSEHQGEIDWAMLAEEPLDFAVIRAGYRGYGESGKLCADAFFEQNIKGAKEHNIPVGVYFFSQATSEKEAEEEAEFLLSLLGDRTLEELSLPVFFDWENIGFEQARTDDVDGKTMTDCALAFCRRIEAAGYTAGVYAYRSLAYFSYDLPRIAEYPLWIGAVGDRPDFYYKFDIWQFSTEGEISGIAGPVDLNTIFVPLTAEKPEA